MSGNFEGGESVFSEEKWIDPIGEIQYSLQEEEKNTKIPTQNVNYGLLKFNRIKESWVFDLFGLEILQSTIKTPFDSFVIK